jgi:hypothetical protein
MAALQRFPAHSRLWCESLSHGKRYWLVGAPATGSQRTTVAARRPGPFSTLHCLHAGQRTSLRVQETQLEPRGKTTSPSKGEQSTRAAHLRDAIQHRAQEKGHSAAELARILDMSVGHWYRLRKEPQRLARLTLARLDIVARYVGWPRVQVMIAIGWLQPAEVDEVISGAGAVEQALQRIKQGSMSNGLRTPLDRASPDHQVLLARLLIAAEAAAVSATSAHVTDD